MYLQNTERFYWSTTLLGNRRMQEHYWPSDLHAQMGYLGQGMLWILTAGVMCLQGARSGL